MRKLRIIFIVFLLFVSTFSLLEAKDQKFLIDSSSGWLSNSTIIFDADGKLGLLTYCEHDYDNDTYVMKVQKLKYLMNKKKLKLVKKPYVVNASELSDMGIKYFNQPYTWFNPSRGSGYVVWTDYPDVSPSSVYIAQLDIKKGKIIGKPYRVPGPTGAAKFTEGDKIDCYMPMGCAFGLFNVVVYSTRINNSQDEKYLGLYMGFTNPLILSHGPQRIAKGSVEDNVKIGERSDIATLFLTCKATAISCAACQDSIVVAFVRQKYDPDRQYAITLACAGKIDVGEVPGDKNSRSECGCSGDIEILPCDEWEVEVAELSQDFSNPTSVSPVGPLKNQPEGNGNETPSIFTLWLFEQDPRLSNLSCNEWKFNKILEDKIKVIEEVWALPNEGFDNSVDSNVKLTNHWVGYSQKSGGHFLYQGMDASKKKIKFIGKIRKSQTVGKEIFNINVTGHGGCAFITYVNKDIKAMKTQLNLYKQDLK
ncbi:MAG: hypothetical protein JW755_03400 [Candidatus Aminicenantes bacterium]|nr:hypothetical protein [Candidatus Aminicenantes bacterium]